MKRDPAAVSSFILHTSSFDAAPHPNPLPCVQGRGDKRGEPSASIERYILPTGTKATWGTHGPAIRLGFRQIKGLRQEGAERIVAARREYGPFASVDQLQHRAGVEAGLVRRLAQADALNSIRLNRRSATWEAMALSNSPAPLFDGLVTPAPAVEAAPLPPMPPREEVLADYASTGLSIKRHPVSFARSALDRWKVATAAQVQQDAGRYPNGRLVSVAGLVLVRQRPGTASGVVFITLEDETGVVNLILWSSIYERYRVAARYATLLQANGIVQREGQVVHVLAKRLIDRTPLLGGLAQSSRDFH
jgi:error-prone DNA polymerase